MEVCQHLLVALHLFFLVSWPDSLDTCCQCCLLNAYLNYNFNLFDLGAFDRLSSPNCRKYIKGRFEANMSLSPGVEGAGRQDTSLVILKSPDIRILGPRWHIHPTDVID